MWSVCFCTFIQEKIIFDINDSIEILSTQMRTFSANLFQNSLWKCHARRKVIIFGFRLVIFPKIQTFQILKLLEIII